MRGEWIVHRTDNTRFPYRIEVRWGLQTVISVRAALPWPGAKGNVFCLRDAGPTPLEEPCERCVVLSMSQHGPLLELALDRPQRKRCNFLVLVKGGQHEQIFLRTEAAIKAHRTRGHVHTKTNAALDVVIDSREKYPWHFPGLEPKRRALPAGDYALLDHEQRLCAVVERKSFDDAKVMLAEFQVFATRMTELAAYAHAAVVLEAQYQDFLTDKMAPMSPSVVARKLAALEARYPTVRIVYAGNRKLAEHWVLRYFEAVATAASKPETMEALQLPLQMGRHAGGMDSDIRAALLQHGGPFSTAEIQQLLPEAPIERIRAQIQVLVGEGTLQAQGHGRGRRWSRNELPA